MNENLTQALEELERNLKDVEEANRLIKSAQDSADKTIKASKTAIEHFKSNSDKISEVINSWLSEYTHKLNEITSSHKEVASNILGGFKEKSDESLIKSSNVISTLDNKIKEIDESVRKNLSDHEKSSNEIIGRLSKEQEDRANESKELTEKIIQDVQEKANAAVGESKKAIEALNGIASEMDHSFRSWLEQYKTKHTEHLEQIDSALKDHIEKYSTSWDRHNAEIKKLLEQYEELSTKIQKLITYLDSVNFPARLDKLDASIATNNASITNFYQQIENIRTDIKGSIQNTNERIDRNDKRIRNSNIFVITLLIILIGLKAFEIFYLKQSIL